MTADGAERLHPLVAEALAQVASCQVRLEYWEKHAEAYGADPLPEELAQRIEFARMDLELQSGALIRLEQKLDAELGG